MEWDKDLAEETGTHPSSLSPSAAAAALPFAMDTDMKLCLQQWGMDKHYPLLHLPQDTSPFSKVLMQSNCLCPFNDRRYCMKTPGGMMKNSFNNAFPGTAKGFFPSSFLVGESCHLLSWKPWRSYSLTSHFPLSLLQPCSAPKAVCSPSPTPQSHGI